MNILTNLVGNSDIKFIYSDARRNEKKADKSVLELLDKLSLNYVSCLPKELPEATKDIISRCICLMEAEFCSSDELKGLDFEFGACTLILIYTYEENLMSLRDVIEKFRPKDILLKPMLTAEVLRAHLEMHRQLKMGPLYDVLFQQDDLVSRTLNEMQTEKVKFYKTDWGFDVETYSDLELLLGLLSFFKQIDLLTTLKVDERKLLAFFYAIRSQYYANNYHSFRHVADVTQFAFRLINIPTIKALLTPLEMFSFLIAAYCHDVGHPGTTNDYQVNAKTQYASMFNDQSVLENQHIRVTIQTLNGSKNFDILENFSEEQSKIFRKILISSILGTDMSKHQDILSKFKNRLFSSASSSSGEAITMVRHPQQWDPNERIDLLVLLLKTADICNISRPTVVVERWAHHLIDEWSQQSDLEKTKKVPLTVWMDRRNIDLCKVQVGFIDGVGRPLFQLLAEYFPEEPELQMLVSSIDKNREFWVKKPRQSIEENK